MAESQEPSVEVSFLRRYNLGNYSHKEYQVKIGGTDTQINEQLSNHQDKVISYITKLEQIVDIANEASQLRAKIETKPETKPEAKAE